MLATLRPTVQRDRLTLDVDAQSLVLYEAFDTWGRGTNVAYGDGHVEFVTDKTKFDAMLAKARQAAAKSTPAAPARP
ncbi:MAG: H-X9-DG-CTERM domain-containing protein [Phycisphaerae bacterium]